MKISVKSPTRVDLAGGTLDCWPLYSLVDSQCLTINFSIGICSEVELTPREDNRIEVIVGDLAFEKIFPDVSELLACEDSELRLIRVLVDYFQPTQGFKLESRSDSPVGAGLGGSSSLTISFLKAFGLWLKREWTDHKIVTVAHNLEAKLIKSPTGTQDYYPAFQAGLHYINYTPDGISLETREIPKKIFTDHLTLVYTGVPHHSGINNWQVIKAVVEGDSQVLSALRSINDVAKRMRKVIDSAQWSEIPQLFEEEYQHRVTLTSHFTSPRIDELKNVVLSSGAHAVKICGAGGGGCVAVWSPLDTKAKVESACRTVGFQLLPLSLEKI